jgi:hypothetical protein
MDPVAEGFIAFAVAGGAVIVKAYEWHQDVRAYRRQR